jgi:SAM-dependent methyltransferase
MTVDPNNPYTQMQIAQYESEADLMNREDHQSHNDNPDYWSKLLGDFADRAAWAGKIALDFGCGTGRNVRNLARMGLLEAHGCDLSAGNLAHARRRCVEERIENVRFWQTDGVGLGIPDGEQWEFLYDFVMSTIVFQHIPVHSIRYQIWQEIYYALKNDGIFSFQMGFGPPRGGLPKAPYHANQMDALATNGQHDVWVETPDQIVDDLVDIGFVSVTTDISHAWEDSHPNWIYVRAIK